MRIPTSLISLGVLLLVWQGAAWGLSAELLPGPVAVAQVLWSEFWHGTLLHHLGVTLGRVAVSFFFALLIGAIIGVLMGRLRLVDRLFDSWLILFLNIPALVVIILAYVWFGLVEAAAVFAVTLNKIPNVVVTMREGARTLDADYFEMAQVYRLGFWTRLRHVVLPQLYPYLMASARSGLALIWKIVLVVELLGRSDGMGFQLHLFFQMFDVERILAYTLAFILVIQCIEALVLKPLDRHASQWRRA